MNRGRGTVVLNEHVLGIDDVRLRDGALVVLATANGPGIFNMRGVARVHGEDGRECWSAPSNYDERIVLGQFDTVQLTWKLSIDGVNGKPVERLARRRS